MNREYELYSYYLNEQDEKIETCSKCGGELEESGECINCDEDHDD
jgi:transcription initiation factor IIE alpha subunit